MVYKKETSPTIPSYSVQWQTFTAFLSHYYYPAARDEGRFQNLAH